MSLKISIDKPRIVYKYYRYAGRNKNGDLLVISPYQRTNHKLNYNIPLKSNRKSTQLTNYENTTCNINSGLHVFIKKGSAQLRARNQSNGTPFPFVVVAFIGTREYHVADGTFQNTLNAVYTQLKLAHVVGFYKDGKKTDEKKL